MRLSVSPTDIALHLIEEQGYEEAVAQARTEVDKCVCHKARSIWQEIGEALMELEIHEKSA